MKKRIEKEDKLSTKENICNSLKSIKFVYGFLIRKRWSCLYLITLYIKSSKFQN